jgi:hypothetical protein
MKEINNGKDDEQDEMRKEEVTNGRKGNLMKRRTIKDGRRWKLEEDEGLKERRTGTGNKWRRERLYTTKNGRRRTGSRKMYDWRKGRLEEDEG